MSTFIRLTDYKSSDEKEQGFFKPENRYEAKQDDFEKIPGSPIGYWVSEKIRTIFYENKNLTDISIPRQGMATSDNDRFLRQWNEVDINKIGFGFENRDVALQSALKWFPYNKGGENRKWFGNDELIVNWENDGQEIKDFRDYKNSTLSSNMGVAGLNDIFKPSISWSLTSSSDFAVRSKEKGFLFDVNGMSIFPEQKNFNYFTAFLNTVVCNKFLAILNPTISFQAGNIKLLPIIISEAATIKQQIHNFANQNINISKEEWDSRETSWDFTRNELLKHKSDGKIKTAYTSYCNYWREKFSTLHANEEELNRLFIDIYELQDELTPDVELKDITILKQEADIVNGELVFNADEIMKQFISYGVGVMFGRYSLDSDGLLIANMGQEVPTDTTFEIDDDNVIPVLEDDYFSDDIASRFISFVKAVFGEEQLKENINFIEKSLGTTIRKYFVKGFYEDHIKRYKKRPIYWMVSSPKKGFMSLLYMHRYKSDIFATVQNSYVREYITKLEASRENYQREADDSSNSNVQRNRATKQVEKITKTLDEVIKFDREVVTKYAQERIEIDLDDGVKVNYCKFKDILYEIKGLCK